MKRALVDAIKRECKAAEDIAAKAATENRALTGEEQSTITNHLTSAKSFKDQGRVEEDMRRQLDELGADIGYDGPPSPEQPTRTDAPKSGGTGRRKSLGAQYVDSAEYKALVKSVPDGRFADSMRVQSQPWAAKDLITSAGHTESAGNLVTPESLGLLDPYYARPLTIRDLVTAGQTDSDTIEFVRLLSVTNNAGMVAEATSSGVIGAGPPIVTAVQGGLKPESAMEFEKDSTTVKAIAHWIPATKRSIADAKQIRTLIDGFLLTGLDEKLEDQIMAGDGTGENLLGIAATSGIQTQAAPTGTETNFDTLRMARRKVRIGGRTVPTAYVLNPIDWEKLELLKDGENRYYGAGPFAMTNPTLWGLPVIESEATPAGTAWCADWKTAVLWDREQATIQMTDAHADFFVRNLVAILAELRAAFAVLRPPAFVKVTLGA